MIDRRPKVAKKKGTKYRKTVTIGHDMHGNALRKDFYGATKHELNQKIDSYKMQLANGTINKKIYIVAFDSWAWEWLETYKDGQVEISTYNVLKSVVKNLCAYFGNAPLHRIKESDVMNFFKKNKHYSTAYLGRCHNMLNQIFNKAVSNNLIEDNPMKSLKKPIGNGEKKKKKAYTYEEYRKVIEFSKTHKDGLGAFIMLKTGVRLSELLGLKGSDIDLEKGIVHVRRISTDSGLKDKGKTENALRSIPIDDECKAYLNTIFLCHSDKFLFANNNGRPKKPTSYRTYVFFKFQDDLRLKYPELPEMTPHEYRHTFGTLLYQSGTELLTLSRIMGHSNTLITQKTYVHDTLEDVIKNVRFPSECIV